MIETEHPVHYVNNKELLEEYKVYFPKVQEAKLAGLERPPIPKNIAHAILQITTKLANSYKFCNYSYKKELIGDATLKCTLKCHLFDPSKSDSPFGYITQIVWNAFIGRIKEEQKQCSIRASLIRNKLTTDFVENLNADEESSNSFVEFLQDNEIFTDYFEIKKDKPDALGNNNQKTKHRNHTPYVKKDKVEKPKKESAADLFELCE